MTELDDQLAAMKEAIDWTDDDPTDADLVEQLRWLVKLEGLVSEWSSLMFSSRDITEEQEERRHDLAYEIGLHLGDLRRVETEPREI